MKSRFETYKDGVMNFGVIKEVYKDGNAERKEFIRNGKLFFNYLSIRERDRFKFNTDLNVEIKLKTIFNTKINANDIIELNGKLYEIAYLDNTDKNKESLFIFLYDYIDKMNNIIEIYKKDKADSLFEDDNTQIVKKAFANIESNIYKDVGTQQSSKNIKIKFTIKYFNELDLLNNKNILSDFKIKFKNNSYNINSIKNIDEMNKLLEIEGELE